MSAVKTMGVGTFAIGVLVGLASSAPAQQQKTEPSALTAPPPTFGAGLAGGVGTKIVTASQAQSELPAMARPAEAMKRLARRDGQEQQDRPIVD